MYSLLSEIFLAFWRLSLILIVFHMNLVSLFTVCFFFSFSFCFFLSWYSDLFLTVTLLVLKVVTTASWQRIEECNIVTLQILSYL